MATTRLNHQQRARLEAFRDRGVGIVMVLAILVAGWAVVHLYQGGFSRDTTITITAPEAGLLMEPGAPVRIRGVRIGRVISIGPSAEGADIVVKLDPKRTRSLSTAARPRLRLSSLFGAKYIDLEDRSKPGDRPLREGDKLSAQKKGPEAQDAFASAMQVLTAVEPQKINATLTAISTGVQGQGSQANETIRLFDNYLAAILPSLDTLGTDIRLANRTLPYIEQSAPQIADVIENFATTSATLQDQRGNIRSLLEQVTGTGGAALALTVDTGPHLTGTIDELAPTTATLKRYAPMLKCTIKGIKRTSDLFQEPWRDGKNGLASGGLLPTAEPYTYPRDLPKVAADTGPQCYGLPVLTPDNPMRHVNFDVGYDHFSGPFGSAQ